MTDERREYPVTDKWTNEIQSNALAHAAVILGVIPNLSMTSRRYLSDMLKARDNVEKRKEGDTQSAPAFYRARYQPETTIEDQP